MGDPDPLREKAARHQAIARTRAPNPSSAFILSTSPHHSQFCSVNKPNKKKVVEAIQSESRIGSGLPRSEKEAARVFAAQSPNLVTTSVFTIISPATSSGDALNNQSLPGGVPLVDHVAAFLKTAPDWQEVSPLVEDLRASRLPTSHEINKGRELILGKSSRDHWIDTQMFLRIKEKESQELLYPVWASDTESIPLKITWNNLPGMKTWEALLFHIKMAVSAGDNSLEFTMAPDGYPACNLPVRFFFGSRDWQIHTLLPITHYRHKGETRIVLHLDTILPEEAKNMYLSLPSMVGVGVTEDYVEWSATISAIWNTDFFEQMQMPFELEHLARAARVNTLQSSIFNLNWWCLGTVLPKSLASLGDKKWSQPLRELPLSLKQYLVGDIVQTVKIAQLLALIWIIQSFPDMTVVRQATSFTVESFIKWSFQKLIPALFTGILVVRRDEQGRWYKVAAQPTWVEQNSVEHMAERLSPPTLNQFPALWGPPDWPSITCGGPRSIHQVRNAFINALVDLQKLDPDSWTVQHTDKLTLWRFGVPAKQATPVLSPVATPGFAISHEIENHLNSNPNLWTKDQLKLSRTSLLRSDRQIIAEFVRVNINRSLDVLSFMETKKAKFRYLVGEPRMMKILIDTRTTIGFLNIKIPREQDWIDPYKVDQYLAAQVEKQKQHSNRRLELLILKSENVIKKIESLKRPFCTTNDSSPVDGTSQQRLEPASKIRIVDHQADDRGESEVRTVRFRKTEEDTEHVPVAIPTKPPSPAKPKKTYLEALKTPRASTPVDQDQSPPSITPAMLSIIQQAVSANDGEIINKTGKVRITGNDIKRVTGKRWLNDSVIEAYFQLIMDRSGKNGLPTVYSISTFFYPLLEKLGYKAASQFTASVDLFSFDLVLIPIHLESRKHWTLIVVDVANTRITYYDSLKEETNHNSVGITIRYLEQEYWTKKGVKLNFQFRSQWDNTAPQQDGGVDCGVFICRFANQLSRREKLRVNMADISIYRQLMIWEICTNQLYSSPSRDLNDSLILWIDQLEMQEFKPEK